MNEITKYRIFRTLDPKSDYHEVAIDIYRVFETRGRIYQFRRIPFDGINAVSIFLEGTR